MKAKTLLSAVVIFIPLVAFSAFQLWAQSHPEYIPLGGGVKGALYKPDSGPPPHVGILVMHRTVNFLSTTACTQLSSRGFMVLCANPSSDNNEALVDWENMPLDVQRGVNFLRSQPGITKVILWAHSGGGPLMTFYQAVAQSGPSYCQGPNKLLQCGNNLAGLPPADGIILADAHPGNRSLGTCELCIRVFLTRIGRISYVLTWIPLIPRTGLIPTGHPPILRSSNKITSKNRRNG